MKKPTDIMKRRECRAAWVVNREAWRTWCAVGRRKLAERARETMRWWAAARSGRSGALAPEPSEAVREQRLARRREKPPLRMWLVVEPVLEVPELQAWHPLSLHDDEKEAKRAAHQLGGGRKAVRAFLDFHVPKWESPSARADRPEDDL